MLERPKFKDYFYVEVLDSEAVFILSEREFYLHQDPLHRWVARAIDGQRSADEIVDHVLDQMLTATAPFQERVLAGAQVYRLLMLWEQQGYLVASETAPLLPSPLMSFCHSLGVNPEAANQRLTITKVGVHSFGPDWTSDLIASLRSLQIQIASSVDEAAIDVVLTDDYLREDLAAFNQKALSQNRPWLLVKPVGTIVWIGPLFQPGQTGCWECLAQRLRDNRPVETYLHRHKGTSLSVVLPQAAFPTAVRTALELSATELFKFIVQGKSTRLAGALVTLDTLSLQLQDHILVKRPQCPICGDPGLSQQVMPLALASRPKTFTSDGGHRCVTPEKTLQNYQHHISPITGIIRDVKSIAPAANGLIRAYLVSHYAAPLLDDDLTALCRNLGGRGAGKGKTDPQARASGLCEAIERYSATLRGDEPRVRKSFQALEEQAIHPNACMIFSDRQYQQRQEWNAQCLSPLQTVPDPFDPVQEIEWTPLWSLTHQSFKYLPTAYCYLGYPANLRPGCWADSNGCAAGNTLEEAILQGFMELVERDSVALWWYNRLHKPGVDLTSFGEPYFTDLQAYYQTLHRDLWVIDITSDLQIPSFAAISRRTDREVEDIVLGYGTHFDPKIAVSRALTEVSQILSAVLCASADGSTQYPIAADPLAVQWWKTTTVANQPYLVPDPGVPLRVGSDYPQLWSDNLLNDVLTSQQIVETKGMELLVLDLTRPDVDLKVVRVVVPGLRHFWRRLGPGRLYEVPVQMGWLAEALPETQLNPFPMWM